MADLLEDSFRSPQRFGPYQRIRELGRGAMGAVLEVEHVETRARLALKVILPHVFDPESVKRFQREALALARLNHPNLARIHAAQFEPPLRYLVLDLYSGGTLKERLANGPLPLSEATEIVGKLADGVAQAHALGILHRDIKPTNVLFADERQPVLCDFGLVRETGSSRMTHTGEVLGTPLYMAPEQVIDGKRTGPEADVYALGAVLYRTLTGRPPIEATPSVVGTLDRVLTQSPRDPRELRPDLDRHLARLCLRALAKDPAERPTAAELAEALLQQRLPEPTPRAPSVLPLAVLAGIALTLALGGFAWTVTRGSTGSADSGPASSLNGERELPPSWVLALRDEHVSLTLCDDRRLLSLLAHSQLETNLDGSWVWVLTPRVARGWDGSRLLQHTTPASNRDAGDARRCASLVGARLWITFDASGEFQSAVNTAPQPGGATPFAELCAQLSDTKLEALVGSLFALETTQRARSLGAEKLVLDREGRLIGARVAPGWGWASLRPCPVAELSDASRTDGVLHLKRLPDGREVELFEGLVLATNARDDPDYGEPPPPGRSHDTDYSPDSARSLDGVLELPPEGADARLRGVRPPYRLVVANGRAQAFSRPWGTPLGALLEDEPYLRLTAPQNDWTPIGWEGGEAWVRDVELSPLEGKAWVGVITVAADDPLNVRRRPDDDPLSRPRWGSLRHGQVVPLNWDPIEKTDRFLFGEDVQGAWAPVPPYGAWVQAPWGTRLGHLRASREDGRGGYHVHLLLAPSGVPLDSRFTQGEAPAAPRTQIR